MKEDCIAKLKKSLMTTGFPLELKVARIFLEKNWKVQYSPYYIDRDEMKGREIDLYVSSHLSGKDKHDTYFENSFGFSVEIKEAIKKPWIFFTDKETRAVYPFEFAANKNFLSSKYLKNFIVDHKSKSLFKEVTAKSFCEGFASNGGRDDIYKALSGSVKSMIHFKDESYPLTDNGAENIFESFNPLVVVNGSLFEASLNTENDNLELKESNYIQVAFNYLSPNYKSSDSRGRNEFIVHVVKLDYLSSFLEQHNKVEEKIFEKYIK